MIPRFSSFKPKTAPPPENSRQHEHRDLSSSERSRRDERSHHHSRHRSRREHEHFHSSDRRAERRERQHYHSRRKDDFSNSTVASEPVVNQDLEQDTDLYIVDRKGDKYNLIYGTAHRYSVPGYHRIGRGSVLGLPPRYKIDRESSQGNAIVLTTDSFRSDATRTKQKSLLSKPDKRPSKFLRVRKDIHRDPINSTDDFISLDVPRKQRRKDGLDDTDSEDERYAYRSIQGKAKPEDVLPDYMDVVSETESEDDEKRRTEVENKVRQENAELSRAVEQNPRDVAAWLRLIEHQGALLGRAVDDERPLSYAEKTSLADIKLSLYTKALKRAGDVTSKDRLLLGLLDEGSKLWDTKKLSEEWQSVLKHNARYISLWIKYLDFRQTEFLDFTYERCLATFVDCLKLNASSWDTPEKAYVQTYLFLRLTAFIKEAGFTEHAAGLWQAILEFTFFQPDRSDQGMPRNQLMLAFREFWESEVARIGEVGARGWKSGASALVEPKKAIPKFHIDRRSIFPSWNACERERTINARMPARSLDELDEDDPYRIVIFDDFEELLSYFWGFELKDVLVEAFLYYCHLPPLTTSGNNQGTRRWVGDNFVQNELLDNPDISLYGWLARSKVDIEDGTPTSPVSFPHNNFINTADTLVSGQHWWFSSFGLWSKGTDKGRSGIDSGWVRRTLRLLVEANPTNDNLAEYSLALESVCDVKEARKYAKSLLKKRSSCLQLYNTYALIECRTGSRETAEHVWATALSMSTAFPDNERIGCSLLWSTWLWELILSQDVARASQLLLSIPRNIFDMKSFQERANAATFSPAELLKIRSVSSGVFFFFFFLLGFDF